MILPLLPLHRATVAKTDNCYYCSVHATIPITLNQTVERNKLSNLFKIYQQNNSFSSHFEYETTSSETYESIMKAFMTLPFLHLHRAIVAKTNWSGIKYFIPAT